MPTRVRAYSKSNFGLDGGITRPESTPHIRSLDGWRGVGFLAVFCFHYGVTTHATTGWAHAAAFAMGGGWMGVDMFFVLSGFLITGILLDTRDSPHYYRNFFARRALRIFPLFYGVMLLLLLLTPVLHLQWHLAHIAYFFYLGNIAGDINVYWNDVQPAVALTHTWSLAVEEQFYLLWPFVVLRVSNRRTLLKVCVAAMAGSMVLRLMFLHLSPSGAAWSYGELPTHCDGLLCGAIVAVLVRKYDVVTLVRNSRGPMIVSLSGLFGIWWFYGNLNFESPWMTLAGYPLLAIFLACILVRAIRPGSVVAKIGQNRILRFFGKYSYGMYIFHWLFVLALTPFLRVLQNKLHSRTLGSLAFMVSVLAGTSIVSVLSYELYEKRWLKLKSRFSDRVQAQSKAA